MKKIYIPIKHRDPLDFILSQFLLTHEEAKDAYSKEFAAAEYILNKITNS